jgi:4-diphosphocytidyl-2-C-methyl-D-erythritol kinase
MNDAGRRVVDAPAKVNLFLRVLGRRPDGYHDLESLVLPLDLADRVEVELADPSVEGGPGLSEEGGPDPSGKGGPSVEGGSAVGVQGRPELTEGVPTDGSNLAARAASALAARLGRSPRPGGPRPDAGAVRIRLLKRIPASGGLGGGSADAAAVLRVLNRLWAPGLDPVELAEVAAEVGSDVPALLAGGPVLMAGRGERVAPARGGRSLRLALVTFGRGVATPEAFGWWDSDGGPTGPDPGAVIEAFEAGAGPASLGPLLFNDLQEPVTRRRPDVRAALDRLVEAGVPALVSGSGPTVFGLLGEGTERLDGDLEGDLRELAGGDVLYARTVDR